MIMDEPSPIFIILPLLRVSVYPDLFLAHSRFWREERMSAESREREGLAPMTTESWGWARELFISHSSAGSASFKRYFGDGFGVFEGGTNQEQGEGKFIPFPHGPREKMGIRP
jgi:hypothetical protein